jgi:hypothetical protein
VQHKLHTAPDFTGVHLAHEAECASLGDGRVGWDPQLSLSWSKDRARIQTDKR